jgi:hypothetical protein
MQAVVAFDLAIICILNEFTSNSQARLEGGGAWSQNTSQLAEESGSAGS